MKTYKQIESGVITMLGKSAVIPASAVEITEEEYNELMEVIRNHPEDTLETKYYLSAETESYVGRAATREEKVDWYIFEIAIGEMTIEDVPEDYKEEVQAKLPTPEPAKYTLDEAADILAQEVNA